MRRRFVIVVDASVVISMLAHDGERGRAARKAMMADPHWSAPAHLIIEVVSGVRELLLSGKISAARAEEALSILGQVEIDLPDLRPLLPRIWALRSNLTAYDASYVALAEAEGCPLLTSDARLAAAPGIRCHVRVV